MELHPYLFCLFFCLLYVSYLLSKTMGCFSGCLMSSAGIQKLLCGIYSAFKCSFDEFVGEKVVSPSYSSTILGLPSQKQFLTHIKLDLLLKLFVPPSLHSPTGLLAQQKHPVE